MAYTTINKSTEHFNTKLYTGNGSTGHAITGVGFQPDWTWFKSRSGTNHHVLFDVVRGVTKGIYPNLGNAEDTLANSLSSFDSDGFTLGADTGSGGAVNGNTNSMVSWNWKAGTTTGINNTGSTIQPATGGYSFNQTSGFSMVKYLGNLTSGAKVPHGLGVAPKMVITKKIGSNSNWITYHAKVNEGTTPQNYAMSLNYNYAKDGESYYWNNTAPDAVNFTLGNSNQVNDNSNYHIAYCFAEIPGYSKVGDFFGNGSASTGKFIYTGFKPKFIITKRDDSTSGGSWLIYDTARNTLNPADKVLSSSDNSNESGWGYNFDIDILSNGFRMTSATTYTNVTNAHYIYYAVAEAPLVGTNGVTAKAR